LLVAVASQLYHMRRSRDRLMPKGLMGEPAWDVLLALFSEEPGRVTLSAVSQASGVPPTSAYRWIDLLSAEGLVERIAHPRDANLMFVSLTEKGRACVRECLGALFRAADD
jgi:DNA-binding MarR family transcriptional regulator